MKTITYQTMQELALELALLQNNLMEAGMLKTFHAIQGATKQIGWEMAEIIEGNHVTKLLDTVKEKNGR